MDFAFEMSYKQTGGQTPYCQNNCPISALAAANMHYFDYVSATLTGGGAIAGFSATLTEKDKDFQFGHEGIGYDDDFGASTWFMMTLTGETEFGDYTLRSTNGDLNVEAALVPLPAAAWFLIAGVSALGVASRRKKAACRVTRDT